MNLLVISGILLNALVSYGPYQNEMRNVIDNLEKNIDNYMIVATEDFKKISVDVTAYSPRVRETDSTPFVTASNKQVKEGYIAISRDLEAHLSFGDKVFIKDIGIFEVQDRMNRRWQKRVDLFFFDTKQALKFGKVTKDMWILESNKTKKTLAKN